MMPPNPPAYPESNNAYTIAAVDYPTLLGEYTILAGRFMTLVDCIVEYQNAGLLRTHGDAKENR